VHGNSARLPSYRSTRGRTCRRGGASLALLLGLACGLLGCGEGNTPDSTSAATSEADSIAYAVSHILIPVDKGRPASTAEPLIRQAARALEAGEDFASVARGRSKDPAAVDGGFLGFVRADADTAFSGAVQSLRPGQTSPPIRTGIGWQIIKRHGFEEARKLEQRYQIPTLGVFVPWDDPEKAPERERTGRTKEQAYAVAVDVRDKLAAGELTLDQAMAMFTAEQHRVPGAYLGPTANRKASRTMYNALKDAKTGALVGPIETPAGFAVLVRGRYLRSLFRHILVQHVDSKDRALSISRTPEAAFALAQKALDEVLADRSAWDQSVGRYSDDHYSRPIGGRMGILHPSHMPEGFELFVYDMKANTIHPKVVQTPYGFHVVWRVN